MRTTHETGARTFTAPAAVDGWLRKSIIAGALGLLAMLIGLFVNKDQFFRSYLIGYIFTWAASVGCLGWLMVYHLTGGAWGTVTRRIFEAGARSLPLVAIASIPLLLGMHSVYEWTHSEVVANDNHLRQLTAKWLNTPFFIVRLVIYFAVWMGLTFVLGKMADRQDEPNPPAMYSRYRLIGGIGILLLGLTVTFASVDWVMSLDPHWYSTIWGLIFINGAALTSIALAIIVLARWQHVDRIGGVGTPDHFHDLGNLQLAMTMVWAYFWFSQYLIIWSGNLPEEITWTLHRSKGGWQYVTVGLMIGQFALPFILMLSRDFKRNARSIALLAMWIIAMRAVDYWWLVAPNFAAEHGAIHLRLSWMDIAAPIGLGGLWLAYFFWNLKRRPMLATYDQHVTDLFERHGH